MDKGAISVNTAHNAGINAYTLMTHDTSHATEEILLNREIFPHIAEGDYVQVFDAEQRGHRLSFRVSFQQRSGQSRVEVSLLKQIAELVQLKPYQKVQVERVADVGAVAIDYIELSFRKQFLQRGNLWRFKEAMIGKAVHAGINANSGNVSATVQELLQNRASGAGAGGGLGVAAGTVGAGGQQQQVRQVPVVSGVVTPSTHFIFRSKSVRLIWLIQISVEMWELDQNGDMYFEKLLYKLITPLLEKWKALAVSHSLTVVFFARTMYIGTLDKATLARPSIIRVNQPGAAGVAARATAGVPEDVCYYEDNYKVVIENIMDIDKVLILQRLKKEFWGFPKSVGWGTHTHSSPATEVGVGGPVEHQYQSVPSDAVNGSFLAAINVTLNLLEKHYMDRDLTRTGNSIVMISPGTGIFQVDPVQAQITKQRMMDSGIGLDFISLSQPPVHSVPLFLISCIDEDFQIADFYEVPHWINVGFVESEVHHQRVHHYGGAGAGAGGTAISAHHIHDTDSSTIVTSSSAKTGGDSSRGGGKTEITTSDASIIGKGPGGGKGSGGGAAGGPGGLSSGGYYYNCARAQALSLGNAFSIQNAHLADEVLNLLWWRQFRPQPFPSQLARHVQHRVAHTRLLVERLLRSHGHCGGDGAEQKQEPLPPVCWGFKSFELSPQNVALHAAGLPPCLVQLICSGAPGRQIGGGEAPQAPSLLPVGTAPAGDGAVAGVPAPPLGTWGHVSFAHGPGLGYGERGAEIWAGRDGPLQPQLAAPVIYKRGDGPGGERPTSTSPLPETPDPTADGAESEAEAGGDIEAGPGGVGGGTAEGLLPRRSVSDSAMALSAGSRDRPVTVFPLTAQHLNRFLPSLPRANSRDNMSMSAADSYVSSLGGSFGTQSQGSFGALMGPQAASWEAGSLGGSQSGYMHHYLGSDKLSFDDPGGCGNSYDHFDEMIESVGQGLGALSEGAGAAGESGDAAPTGGTQGKQISTDDICRMISAGGGGTAQLLRLMALHDSTPGGGSHPYSHPNPNANASAGQHPAAPGSPASVAGSGTGSGSGVVPGRRRGASNSGEGDWQPQPRSFDRDRDRRDPPRTAGILKHSRPHRALSTMGAQQQHQTSFQPARGRTQSSGGASGSYDPDRAAGAAGAAAATFGGHAHAHSRSADLVAEDLAVVAGRPRLGSGSGSGLGATASPGARRPGGAAPATPVLSRGIRGGAVGLRQPAPSLPPPPQAQPQTQAPRSLPKTQSGAVGQAGGKGTGGSSFFPAFIASMLPGLFGTAQASSAAAPVKAVSRSEAGGLAAAGAGLGTALGGSSDPAGSGAAVSSGGASAKDRASTTPGRGAANASVQRSGSGNGSGNGGANPRGRDRHDKHVSMNFGPALHHYPGGGGHYSHRTPAKPAKVPLHSADSLSHANASAAALPVMSASVGDSAFGGFQLSGSLSGSFPKRSGLMTHQNFAPAAANMLAAGGTGTGGTGGGVAGASDRGQTVPQQHPPQAEEPEDEKATRYEFYKTYRRKYSYNPFRREEGRSHVAMRTQNRRRWIHVFPQESKTKLTVGLNWKSLCQPALLPLTTDFLPSPTDLRTKYDVARNYSKILVADDICGFDTPANLLMEMICQRLAMDYQLVEGVAIAEYEEFFNTSANMAQGAANKPGGGSGGGSSTVAAKVAKSVASAKSAPLPVPGGADSTSINTRANKSAGARGGKSMSTNKHVSCVSSVAGLSEFRYYILSMGHRIQFLVYDPDLRNISVTLCIAKDTHNLSDANKRSRKSMYNKFAYHYQLWVPNFQHWKLITQVCHKFAKEEYNWSQSDEILLGEIMEEENMRNATAKRLRFVIVPDHFEQLARLDRVAGGVDGIQFDFRVGRSATMPISDFAAFSVPTPPKVGGGGAGAGAGPDTAAGAELPADAAPPSGEAAFAQQLTPVRMSGKGGAAAGTAAGAASATAAVSGSPAASVAPVPLAVPAGTAGGRSNADAEPSASSANASAAAGPALEQAQALTSSAGDAAFINTVALQRWRTIMKLTVPRTPPSGDFEGMYKGKVDQLLQFIRKKMAAQEKLDVQYTDIATLFPGCKKLPKDRVLLRVLLIAPNPAPPAAAGAGAGAGKEPDAAAAAAAVAFDAAAWVEEQLRAAEKVIAADLSVPDVLVSVVRAAGAAAAVEALTLAARPAAVAAAIKSEGQAGAAGVASVSASTSISASTSAASSSAGGAGASASSVESAEAREREQFAAVLVATSPAVAGPVLAAIREDGGYNGGMYLVGDASTAASAAAGPSPQQQALCAAFGASVLAGAPSAYLTLLRALAEQGRRPQHATAAAAARVGEGAVVAGAAVAVPPQSPVRSQLTLAVQQRPPAPSKAIIKQYQYTRITMSDNKANPKWCYLRSDKTFSLRRPLHLEFSWISCDAWLLDEWISVLFRRCSHFNLRVIQLPEFFFSDQIQLHSFRAQPYIQIPCTYAVGSNKTVGMGAAPGDAAAGQQGLEQQGQVAAVGAGFAGESPCYHFISPVLIVERIFLRARQIDWIEDDPQFTDWLSVGVPIPPTEYLNGAHYDVHHPRNLELDPADASFSFGTPVRDESAAAAAAAAGPQDPSASASASASVPAQGGGPPAAAAAAPAPSPSQRPVATSALTDALTGVRSRGSSLAPLPNASAMAAAASPTGPSGAAAVTTGAASAASLATGTATAAATAAATATAKAAAAAAYAGSRSYGKRTDRDRQYILRLGNGGLRVGSGGFIWLLNMAANMNELKTYDEKKLSFPVEERKETGLAKLHEFQILCTDVGIVLDILNEAIDVSCNIAAVRRRQRAAEAARALLEPQAEAKTEPGAAVETKFKKALVSTVDASASASASAGSARGEAATVADAGTACTSVGVGGSPSSGHTTPVPVGTADEGGAAVVVAGGSESLAAAAAAAVADAMPLASSVPAEAAPAPAPAPRGPDSPSAAATTEPSATVTDAALAADPPVQAVQESGRQEPPTAPAVAEPTAEQE